MNIRGIIQKAFGKPPNITFPTFVMYSHGFPQGYLQRSLSESLLFIWQLVVVCYVPSTAPGIRDVSLNKTDPKPSLSPGGAYSHFFYKPTRILGLIAAVSQMLRPGVICFFLSTIPRILGHKYLLENPFPVWGKKKKIFVFHGAKEGQEINCLLVGCISEWPVCGQC